MTMIQSEMLDEKGTKNVQSGIQVRNGGIGIGTWLQPGFSINERVSRPTRNTQ
jgi:hypothetical protein